MAKTTSVVLTEPMNKSLVAYTEQRILVLSKVVKIHSISHYQPSIQDLPSTSSSILSSKSPLERSS
jgi:hypothetical protein